MRRAALPLLLLAVVAVGAIYLLTGGDSERERGHREAAGSPAGETSATRESTTPESAEEGGKTFSRTIVVRDEEKNPVEGVTVGRFENALFVGETVQTDADGRCRPALPLRPWVPVALWHPEYVMGMAWVTSTKKDDVEVTLLRGAPLTLLVLSPSKKPVAGAKVSTQHTSTEGMAGFSTWRRTHRYGSATTDIDGRAHVGGMPAVEVQLTVDHKDYAVHRSMLEIRDLSPIEHRVHLDAGGVLEGRVLDDKGAGVEGAEVRLRNVGRPKAKSGPGGAYRLEHVEIGTVQVLAGAEGFGPGFFGQTLGWNDPVPITVRGGQTLTGIDIVLGKPTWITGLVIDDEKQPVKDVQVGAWVARATNFDGGGVTNAEGRFRLGPFSLRDKGNAHLWFSAGEHVVPQPKPRQALPGEDVDFGTLRATRTATVRGVLLDTENKPVAEGTVAGRPGWNTAVVEKDGTFEVKSLPPGKAYLVGERREPTVLKSTPLTLELAAGEVREDVEVRLLATHSIKGRVITPQGKPRMGADVVIKPLDYEKIKDPSVYTGEYRAWSDKDGNFEFKELTAGKYKVGIRGAGSPWDQDVKFREQPAPVTVDAGAANLEFVLPLKGGIVTGRVISKRDGKPIKKFQASFIRYKFFLPNETDSGTFQGGTFRQEVDQPGTWQVDISADGFASVRTDRFEMKEGDVKDLGAIRLGDGGTIAGAVRDAQGQPVPYTRINILNAKFQTNDEEPFTDIEGNFELKGIAPATYTVFAVSPSHPLTFVRNVVVREGGRTDVAVNFVESAPLEIAVTDSGGNPIKDAEFSFTFPAIAPLHSKLFRNKIPPGYGDYRSNDAGLIFQHSLPPGEVTITLDAKGFQSETKKLELKPGEANRVEIRLKRDLK